MAATSIEIEEKTVTVREDRVGRLIGKNGTVLQLIRTQTGVQHIHVGSRVENGSSSNARNGSDDEEGLLAAIATLALPTAPAASPAATPPVAQPAAPPAAPRAEQAAALPAAAPPAEREDDVPRCKVVIRGTHSSIAQCLLWVKSAVEGGIMWLRADSAVARLLLAKQSDGAEELLRNIEQHTHTRIRCKEEVAEGGEKYGPAGLRVIILPTSLAPGECECATCILALVLS